MSGLSKNKKYVDDWDVCKPGDPLLSGFSSFSRSPPGCSNPLGHPLHENTCVQCLVERVGSTNSILRSNNCFQDPPQNCGFLLQVKHIVRTDTHRRNRKNTTPASLWISKSSPILAGELLPISRNSDASKLMSDCADAGAFFCSFLP